MSRRSIVERQDMSCPRTSKPCLALTEGNTDNGYQERPTRCFVSVGTLFQERHLHKEESVYYHHPFRIGRDLIPPGSQDLK